MVAFKNTIFWCWIWALIHANHFYNLELIECKAYIAPRCISIPLSNLVWDFPKKSITYNLEQYCWDKIENLIFPWKKTLLPPSQCCWQSFKLFGNKFFPKLTLMLEGKRENFEFQKLSIFLNLLDFRLLSQQVLSRILVWKQ